jgi:hypothetical protein
LSASHVSSSIPVAKATMLETSSKQARVPRIQVIAASHDDTESFSDDEEHTIDWCKKAPENIKCECNKDVVEYIIEQILPQVDVGVLLPIFICLCPTPLWRGNESLGGLGCLTPNMKTALSIRLINALNCGLPSREQGGIDSGNPMLCNGCCLNARETCTNDGCQCNFC